MGAPAARITAADFRAPPELRDWHLADHAAGRIGGVRLELVSDGQVTRLGQCYQQVPLRVLPPFHFGAGQPALLYLLNPTAGLLDGDGQLVELTARAGSRAVVVGQSATRIHPSVAGFSTQQWDIRVDAGAVLVVLSGPAIPFPGCRYYQRVTVNLEEGASFIWGDIWLSGRYARGEGAEQFQFDRLIQEFEVRRRERTVFRDRFCWRGPWDREAAGWHFGLRPACGSLFATGPVDESLFAPSKPAARALFPTAQGDTCCRWQGTSEEVAWAVVEMALRLGPARAGQAPSEMWLLPGSELAPNHWFSLPDFEDLT
jgi:urease accessory protein